MSESRNRLDRLTSILSQNPQLPQRQDSVSDQLADLRSVANRLGMYDAADVIRDILESSQNRK